jgi:hypothetical protein
MLLDAGASNNIRDLKNRRPIDYVSDYHDERVSRKIIEVFKQYGISKEIQLMPQFKMKKTTRYMLSGLLCAIKIVLLFFVLPNVDASGLRIMLILAILSCLVSYCYTFLMSGGLKPRTVDDMLTSLRDGVDPSLMCPSCNIMQSRAVHCSICNTCVADPYCQHSHLLATCITARNRNGFIFFTGSLLALDLVLLMISITNFRIEIIPGLQNGVDGPFNVIISLIFIFTIVMTVPLLQLLR